MLLFQIHKPSQTASSSLILFRCSSMPMASSLFRSSFLLGCVCGVSGRGEDADGPHYTYVFEGIVLTVMILVLSNCMLASRMWFTAATPVSSQEGVPTESREAAVQCELDHQNSLRRSSLQTVDRIYIAPTGSRFHTNPSCGHLKHCTKTEMLTGCLHCSGMASR